MPARRDPCSTDCPASLTLGRLLDALADPGVADGLRRCANPACDRPLVGLRADAKCCSGGCRAAVSRLRASKTGVRYCANPACARPLDGAAGGNGTRRRRDAKCCSGACRAALSRLRRRQEEEARAVAFWAGIGAMARPRSRSPHAGRHRRTQAHCSTVRTSVRG